MVVFIARGMPYVLRVCLSLSLCLCVGLCMGVCAGNCLNAASPCQRCHVSPVWLPPLLVVMVCDVMVVMVCDGL